MCLIPNLIFTSKTSKAGHTTLTIEVNCASVFRAAPAQINFSANFLSVGDQVSREQTALTAGAIQTSGA